LRRSAVLLLALGLLLGPSRAQAQEKPLLLAAIWGSLASYGLAAFHHDGFQCRVRPGYEVQVLADKELTAFAAGLSFVDCERPRWAGPVGMRFDPLLLGAHWTARSGGGADFAAELAALPRIQHVLPLGPVRLDLQLAVGPALLSEPDVGTRHKSTRFQFSDELGFGLSDESGRLRVGWLFRHLSNAGLARPNNRVDFYGASLDVRWP
jgi:hypothetical protein